MGYYDYVFAMGTAFCILDAMGCGANDVANSMATAVNSKTLSMIQAMMMATVFEILGAMTLGSYNASTIRSSIIQLSFFDKKGGALMFGMLCSVMSSCTFNFLSNRFGWATSSTHATIGALIGVGVASGSGVTWGYTLAYKNGALSSQNGLGAVIASFVISPVMAGCIAGLVYAGVKYLVMEKKGADSFKWALRSLPFWYALVVAFEAWLIVWKSPRACNPPKVTQPCMPAYTDNEVIGIFFGVFLIMGTLTALLAVPYVRRTVWLGWTGLRVYHLPLMVLPDATLLKLLPGADKTAPWFDDRHLKGEEEPATEAWAWSEKDQQLIHRMRFNLPETAFEKKAPAAAAPDASDPETATDAVVVVTSPIPAADADSSVANPSGLNTTYQPILAYKSAWTERVSSYKADMGNKELSMGQKAWRSIKFFGLYGVDRDIADHGLDNAEVAQIHDSASKYYGKTEMVFRFLQALTSSVACFAHGANDVGISVGPLAIMYYMWANGPTAARGSMRSSIDVNDWQLAVAAVSLVLGLWFYGYNMMRVLGNRLTFHSPSRGFSMELGSAITILIAARNGIPVSTTNCIVGATIGVGIVSDGLRNVNWKLASFTLFTWLLTVPACGLMSGLVYAFATYSPHVECASYQIKVAPGSSSFMLNGVNYTTTQTVWPAGC